MRTCLIFLRTARFRKIRTVKKISTPSGSVLPMQLQSLQEAGHLFFSFAGLLILWMLANVLLAAKAFDPYPFILLNLALSCVAAVQAPLIMMSQNRQEEKDRRRAENDYKVNLKTEIMIEDLYDKVNAIFALQKELLKELRLQNEGVNPAARQTQNTMTPHTQSIDPENTTAIEAVVQTATDNS